MNIDEEDYIAHYGTLHRSGRYPWGSGDNAVDTRHMTFLDAVDHLRSQGLTDPQIAEGMNISTTQFRARRTIANAAVKEAQISMAQRLKDRGNSPSAIAKRMGLPGESSVRALLAPEAKRRVEVLFKTSDMLKKEVDDKKWLDVGTGVEAHIGSGIEGKIGISKEKLGAAVAILQEQGYKVHEVPVPQAGTGFDTKTKVLGLPGTTQNEAWQNRDNIKQIAAFTNDGGSSWGKVNHPPISIDPSRITVRYKEEGGSDADGVLYVRPGVEDVNLGRNRYAQVRVLVGGTHYLKGMAIYKNDLPKGTDIVFNTNKTSTGNKLDAMKPIGSDKDYPFGSVVRQIVVNPDTPEERNTSAMNIVNEQGDWSKWGKTLSSQMLSKQSPSLAKSQLDMTYERRKKEFDEINALTNPTVKRKLLETFAEEADSASVHLKAAALPKSNWHAILPIDSMPPTQIYAPNYNDGDRVVLLRYPHGGTFEIPQLIVNNKNREAMAVIGADSRDAVGIHHTVAQRLSGADFDGDTVLVIPNGSNRIKSTPALEQLKNFDPKVYALPENSPIPSITSDRMQREMGSISNLITDMTLKLAPTDELVRAIKHSMVVIDSEKHNLNFKQSALDNGIAKLKQEYQGGPRAGASTLISRKKSVDRKVLDRKGRLQKQGGPIDKATGQKVYVNTGRMRIDKKTGTLVPKTTTVYKLAETTDAHTLSSGTPMESLYADHSNKLKALANEARLTAIRTPLLKQSKSAKLTYAKEVESLNSKLTLVVMNRPRERNAQVIVGAKMRLIRQDNPNLDKKSIKKIRFAEQEKARKLTGSKSQNIKFTQQEWNAIQAGAISDNKLRQMLDKSDLEVVRAFATPRQVVMMTPNKTDRAKSMLASGYTRSAVAEALGVSLSTLDNATTSTE